MITEAMAALLADPFFARLKSLVINSTGMAFYSDKDEDLARIAADRMEACKLSDCASYLTLLEREPGHGGEMEALVAELTIGETYFFRHKEQFDALRDTILPNVIARNQAFKRLRIWSAGCSIGPEPYTLAIMLKREFGQKLADWHISIIATDINQKFLARAREARYDEWAFRTTPDDIRRDCFDKVAKHWVLKSQFRSLVTFQYHNLTRNRFPSLVDNIAAFDIIICRNVIIYFSPETVAQLVPCFRESLMDGGWLIMGHAEPNMELFRDFRTVNVPGAVLYQRVDRPETAEPAQMAVAPRPLAPPPPSPCRPAAPTPVRRPSPARQKAAFVAPRPVAPPAEGAAKVRRLADSGQWNEALASCDALLAATGLDWRLHLLRALILEQLGDGAGCETALRRAIYLDRKAVLPHYHLGLFLARGDDNNGARRSFRNVLALLADLPDDHPIEDGDDLTASQLRESVEMHLKLIGSS
ncbi:Chemotaxis protein methyltransferase [Magnetospirillum sp. LM-5]|uniref:CheR family methyltransferase n=1 Tax=Magnetospirillum sp. LM-5 TaxID=2681466 RepID=UPI00137E13A2|nr:protein-glutamate O-methyltransferase CheR [Magnetospirillum sp. LM-5]CAA7612009.1 Chemotaxis protein methyltransferase [Magnetospirillum sp. LM-5]